MPNKNTIPDFDSSDLQSVATTVRAIKDIVEVLAGLRQGEALGAPQMFVQPLTPGRNNANTRSRPTAPTVGDLWIDPDTQVLNFYDGRQWNEILANPVTS